MWSVRWYHKSICHGPLYAERMWTVQGVETAPLGGGWSSCNSSHLGLVDFQVVGAGAMLRTGRVYIGVGLLVCRVGSDVAVVSWGILTWHQGFGGLGWMRICIVGSVMGVTNSELLFTVSGSTSGWCQKLRQSRREMQSNARALFIYYQKIKLKWQQILKYMDGWVCQKNQECLCVFVLSLWCEQFTVWANKPTAIRSKAQDTVSRQEGLT